MTKGGVAALVLAACAITAAAMLRWPAFALVGVGVAIGLVVGLAAVLRPSGLTIERAIQPPRVPKGEPAIAFLRFANTGRSRLGVTIAHQPFGDVRVQTVIPRLRRGERGVRTYRLPTTRRGVFEVGPVEVTRRDPFELFRTARRYGEPERIWVYPRILPFRPLPTGVARHLEGPSSDMSPPGTITFHRLRDYVPGDDLRLIHWRSTARTGRLVVRHNVDTSQPYTVVLLDLRPDRYTERSFECAVDVTASALACMATDKAPVQLRLTDHTVLGGRDITPLLDHLTAVQPNAAGSLREQLLRLRRVAGTALVVVTGVLERPDLPYVAALRRRFERLVVVSLDDGSPVVHGFPGVAMITAGDANEACHGWNLQVHA